MNLKRKEIAQDTLLYTRQGYYVTNGRRVDFAALQKHSEDNSAVIAPEQGMELLRRCKPSADRKQARQSVVNEAVVKTILDFAETGTSGVGVLNFASAKNPGGGFLNGAMAQEESLATSGGLYCAQMRGEAYYAANRACKSMMYTDYAIYTPDAVFFRDERFQLLERPVTASVLTLPAVNYGQVLLKEEDSGKAKRVMKDRMRLALAIFADKGDKTLVLGAYGCGVFRNDPVEVAGWWKELLEDEGYGTLFDEIVFAVLDSSKSGSCIRAFHHAFGND